jgi:hypothetical protein
MSLYELDRDLKISEKNSEKAPEGAGLPLLSMAALVLLFQGKRRR